MYRNNEHKRICFVATLLVTLNTFTKPLTKHLMQNGWNVTWISAEDPKLIHAIPDGVRYIPLFIKRSIDIFGVPRAILTLYRLFKNEHFHIVQYSTPIAVFCAATAAWLAKVPVRLYAQWGIRYIGFDGLARSFFKQLEIWSCYCSTIIEPDSLSNLNFCIKNKFYPAHKGRVIWNGSACGVDLEKFDISKKKAWRAEYRTRLGLGPDHFVIGFVGSIRRDKGCNELITACRSFFLDNPDARLLLIGDKAFYHTIYKDLRDWAESSSQVIYISPNKEIPQYMACMDVFSLPSYREGFGIVIIEAESMGVPVVVSDVPGPIDAMLDGKTGIVVPVKDANALSIALRILLSDSVKRVEYGAASEIYSRKNFEQKELLRHILKDKEALIKQICDITSDEIHS